jgi:hypothetical protein
MLVFGRLNLRRLSIQDFGTDHKLDVNKLELGSKISTLTNLKSLTIKLGGKPFGAF